MKIFVFNFVFIGFIGFLLVACAPMYSAGFGSAFLEAQHLDTISAYETFMKSHPNSPFIKQAKRRLRELKEKLVFEEAQAKNTNVAYRDFIQRYPDSVFVKKAKRKITEDDKEAFNRTMRVGSIQAFNSFIENYPNSKYVQMARGRISFLKITAEGKYKLFIKEYPDSPFSFEAKASIPVLWLKEQKKIGIMIDIENFVSWKGILGGGEVTKDKIFQNVSRIIKKTLEEREDIHVVLLGNQHSAKPKGIQTILIVHYSAVKGENVHTHIPFAVPIPIGHYAGSELFYCVSVDSIIGSLRVVFLGYPIDNLSSITIKDIDTGLEYYSDISDLNKKAKRVDVIKALTVFGGKALSSLLFALNDKDWQVRKTAADVLRRIRDVRAVEPLITALGDDISDVQKSVIRALYDLDPNWTERKTARKSFYNFIIALKDEDSGVRETAANALGGFKDVRAVEPLIATLKDKDGYVRESASYALNNIDPNWNTSKAAKEAVPGFIIALKDEDSGVRETAANALGGFKDVRAVEPLIATLKDKDGCVRKSASYALNNIDPNWNIRRAAKEAVPGFVAALKDKDWHIREAASYALGEIKDRRAVEPLIATLKDLDLDVRKSAAYALLRIKDFRAIGPLISALKDSIPNVREAARDALEKITGKHFGLDYERWKRWRNGEKSRKRGTIL